MRYNLTRSLTGVQKFDARTAENAKFKAEFIMGNVKVRWRPTVRGFVALKGSTVVAILEPDCCPECGRPYLDVDVHQECRSK